MSADIDKIVHIINEQSVGNDPQKVANLVSKKLEAYDTEKFEKIIHGLSQTGSLEIALYLIKSKPEEQKNLLNSLFDVICQEKYYDSQVVSHFNTLMEKSDFDSVRDFILTLENDYFSALSQVGFFGELQPDDQSGPTDVSAFNFDASSGALPDTGDSTSQISESIKSPFLNEYSESDESSGPQNVFEPERIDQEDVIKEPAETDLEVKHIFSALFEEIFADGIVTDVEKRFIGDLRRVFRITSADYKKLYLEADEKYKQGLLTGKSEADPLKVYEKIVAKALEDKVLTDQEKDILFSVAQTLMIDMDTHLELIKKYSS